jgi:hypothetical protein
MVIFSIDFRANTNLNLVRPILYGLIVSPELTIN